MTQQALAECNQQESLLASFTAHLATTKHLLATGVSSQQDEMQ
jgi:hypothetical protein